MVVSGHTPLPPPDGDSGDEVSDELPMMTKAFDSRRNVVLIKVHCIQTRLEECSGTPLVDTLGTW